MKIIITEVGPLQWDIERYIAEPFDNGRISDKPDIDAHLRYEAGDPLPEVIWSLDIFEGGDDKHRDDRHLDSIHINEVDGPVDKGPDWNQVMNEIRNYQL